MSDQEMKRCLGMLQELVDEIEALQALLGTQEARSRAGKDAARATLKRLKGRLSDEYRRTSRVKGQVVMSDIERDYYAPAVHEAYCDLAVPAGSVPGDAWGYDLMSARIDLGHAMGELRNQLGG